MIVNQTTTVRPSSSTRGRKTPIVDGAATSALAGQASAAVSRSCSPVACWSAILARVVHHMMRAKPLTSSTDRDGMLGDLRSAGGLAGARERLNDALREAFRDSCESCLRFGGTALEDCGAALDDLALAFALRSRSHVEAALKTIVARVSSEVRVREVASRGRYAESETNDACMLIRGRNIEDDRSASHALGNVRLLKRRWAPRSARSAS
jgi:hypothetical protein